MNEETVLELPLDRVIPDPNQARKYFDEGKIGELAESIAKHGLLQPILARPWNGVYRIVHGERVRCATIDELNAHIYTDRADKERWRIIIERNNGADVNE